MANLRGSECSAKKWLESMESRGNLQKPSEAYVFLLFTQPTNQNIRGGDEVCSKHALDFKDLACVCAW